MANVLCYAYSASCSVWVRPFVDWEPRLREKKERDQIGPFSFIKEQGEPFISIFFFRLQAIIALYNIHI
jgi:hypothetical protein